MRPCGAAFFLPSIRFTIAYAQVKPACAAVRIFPSVREPTPTCARISLRNSRAQRLARGLLIVSGRAQQQRRDECRSVSVGLASQHVGLRERRIYETLENECDRMCIVTDRCHTVVGASAIDYWIVDVGSNCARDDNPSADRDGAATQRVRRVDGRSAYRLREFRKRVECAVLRNVWQGACRLREKLLSEQAARTSRKAGQRAIELERQRYGRSGEQQFRHVGRAEVAICWYRGCDD